MTQLTLTLSEKLRDEGIERSASHAEAKCPGWRDAAYQFLLDYPRHRFQTEDLRDWAERQGLPKPPDTRSWGSVVVKAKRAGLIFCSGYESVSNPRAHKRLASVWERKG